MTVKIKRNGLEIECSVEDAKALFPDLFTNSTDRTNEQVEEPERKVIRTPEDIEAHIKAAKGIKKISYPDVRAKPTYQGKKRGHQRWTNEEDSYLREHYNLRYGTTDKIAVALGRTKKGVSVRAQRLGLTKNEEYSAPTKKEERQIKKGADNRFLSWTDEDLSYLREHFKPVWASAVKIGAALKRTPGSVWIKAFRLGLRGKNDDEKVVVVQKTAPNVKKSDDDARIKRMRFVNSRAQNLCRQYGWKYEKAFKQASDEWLEAKKKQEKEKMPPMKGEFPLVFKTLAAGHSKNLAPVLHHIISNKGCLKIDEMERLCNPAIGFWNNLTWERFLAEFIQRSKEVSDYFGVRNRWSIKREEGRETLCYGE